MARHPLFARLYPAMSRGLDRAGLTPHRQRLLAGLTGTVVDIGAGHGPNFPHYPPSVAQVIAVEPEPHLRQLAHTVGKQAPIPVEVVDGTAQRLPLPDHSVDAAVVTLVLCSVPDQHAALAEIRRVLTPGGQLRFLEHVRADTPGWARTQRALDATIYPHLAGGCHLGRDTTTAIRRAGFTITTLEKFLVPDKPSPMSFHILGTAVTAERE